VLGGAWVLAWGWGGGWVLAWVLGGALAVMNDTTSLNNIVYNKLTFLYKNTVLIIVYSAVH
jgi:hypothetical protein